MTVRRAGTWKDATRRALDGVLASTLPSGYRLFPILTQVDGYLLPHEAVFLYWLARLGPGEGDIVEIGSLRGRSTLCLAAGASLRPETRVFTVDPHVYGTHEELLENLEHFDALDIVEPICAPSTTAAESWTAGLRVLFVDGDHREAAVDADLDAWLPHLMPGGFLLLHDSAGPSAFPGPAAVVKRRVTPGSEFDRIDTLGSVTWARRGGAADAWQPPTWGRRTLEPVIMGLKAMKAARRPKAADTS